MKNIDFTDFFNVFLSGATISALCFFLGFIGIFLPVHHFESRMKKYMEMANGIGLACRGNIVDMLRDRASITPAKNDK